MEDIFYLNTKLCDVNLFIQEVQITIDQLQGDLQSIGTTLKLSPSQSHNYFQRLLSTQGKLATLHSQDANIRATLISIQSMLTPHMEVLHKELAFTETLNNIDNQLSTHDGLVVLAA